MGSINIVAGYLTSSNSIFPPSDNSHMSFGALVDFNETANEDKTEDNDGISHCSY
jgi:hypothetical protein